MQQYHLLLAIPKLWILLIFNTVSGETTDEIND